jgi:hypothetical protein
VTRLLVFSLLVLLLSGCAVPPRSPEPPAGLHSPFAGFESERYRQARWWLCLPGRDDACAVNLDATELRPDGGRVEVRDTRAPGADDVDCFYLYPTVDLRPWPASHEDFSDIGVQRTVAIMQAARFRSVCNVYAPLYRQTTIGAYNRGHKIVLVGHSQGGEMVVALLKRFFDGDPAMRARLLIAMPIGWPVEVLPGRTTGGTFENIPVCTARAESGCVVALRTYDAQAPAKPGRARPAWGMQSACVEPSMLAHGTPLASRSFFGVPGWYGMPAWVFSLQGVGAVRTPFVMVRDMYEMHCNDGADGFRYLAVGVRPGDARESPVDLGSVWLHGELGTHVLDMQFVQGDLMDLVAEAAAAGSPEKPGVERGQ